MAGKFELDDNIDIKLGEPAYYSISGNELSDISAKPYFDPNFREDVILNWNESTTLKFKVCGSPKKEIWGRVTQPKLTTPAPKLTTLDVKRKFCIKKPGLASGKAEIECNVVIKRTNAGHAGFWHLITWYGESPDDKNKASSRRHVINKNNSSEEDEDGGRCSIL